MAGSRSVPAGGRQSNAWNFYLEAFDLNAEIPLSLVDGPRRDRGETRHLPMSDTKACDCIDCGLPPCAMCAEDHGGLEFHEGDKTTRLCRGCWQDAMMNRLWLHEQANPGSLDQRLRELADMLNAKARAHMGRA